MTRTSLISFFALTVGIGGALAAGVGLDRDDLAPAATLDKQEAAIHAASVFARADLDNDNKLSADEYAALSIVTAELGRLNGYVTIEGVGDDRTIALPIAAPSAVSRAERARIEAVARSDYYANAGSDGVLSADEFVAMSDQRFEQADRNRNGALTRSELVAFAASEAGIAAPGV